MLSVMGPIEVTEDSFPFNAAKRQYKPIDLASYGYVEEEFFVSGLANVYKWYYSDNVAATIRTLGAPYTTRILVRRPTNHSIFSGNVIVELFNWARNYDNPWGGWAESFTYFLDHHDAWVGITIRPSAVVGLKKFNTDRYSPLSFANPLTISETCPKQGAYPNSPSSPLTEDGLAWDIISQVGALVRSSTRANPLASYKVEYVFATAATGGDLSAYVSAIHPLAKLDNGHPIYDGYVIKCTGSPGAINQCEPKIPFDDPRCKLHVDVPVIRVMTQGDILGKGYHPDWSFLYRQPDSDMYGEQYRLYEVVGSYIFTIYPQLSGPCERDVVKAGGTWREPPPVPYYDFPLRYIMNGAFANLDLWVRYGIPPPRAERLATTGEYPNVEFVLDQFGNIRGGVRTPYIDVPIVTYGWNGKVTPFNDKLLKQLYPSHEHYVRKVVAQTDGLLKDRWITVSDAELMKEQAIRAEVP
jgi:hypothetical protein